MLFPEAKNMLNLRSFTQVSLNFNDSESLTLNHVLNRLSYAVFSYRLKKPILQLISK